MTGASASEQPGRTFSALRVTGPDRIGFLQGQLTQDMTQLSAAKALLAGWNSPKGRLLCIMWIVEWRDSVWLLLPAELRAQVEQRLRLFVLRADVAIEPSAEPVGFYNIDTNHNFMSFSSDALSASLVTAPGMALRLGEPIDDRPAPDWRRRLIAAGIPTVWAETQEAFVPQMVNLDLLNAISFSKGCYVGQEIVARAQNLGRIKRRMYLFRLPGEHTIDPGTTIEAAGKVAGQVVDAQCGDGHTLILGVIRIENLQNSLVLEGLPDATLTRETLPYAVPESV